MVMTVQSTAEYWSNVEKCDLFNESELAELRQRFEAVDDASLLARKFIDARLFTDWQARFLLSGRYHLKVGQYVLLERIPGRIVGDRFLAIHTGLDRQVEVNLFPASVAKNEGLFQQFLSQASRVVGMDHRNLVHLYDIDREGTRYYFVYEHDTGTPLDRLVPGQIDIRTIAEITRQILDGIGYAHQNQLIHGQLNETQVRIGEKNQIRISNVGLATMMDQLAQLEGQADDPFGNRPLVNEDTAAAGRIGLSLLEQHIDESSDEDYRQLQAIFRDLSLVVKHDDQTNQTFMGRIDAWIQQHDAAQVPTDPFEPLPASEDFSPNQKLDQRSANGSTARAVASRPLANQNDAASDVSRNRNKLVGTVVGGIIAVLLGGFAWYLFFGGGDSGADLSKANSLDDVTNENRNDGSLVDAALRIPAGNARTSTRGNSDNSKPKSSLDKVTGGSDSTGPEQPLTDVQTPANNSSDETGQTEPELPEPGETTDADLSVDAQESTPTTASETPIATQQETTPDAAPVIGGTWNGLTVIDWKKAAEYIDQEVVVPGKIVDVGKSRSGAIHFLNFSKSSRDAFTVIIREKSYDKFPGEIETLYKNMEVVVTGKIFLFEDRVAEIEVTSPEQIRLASELSTDPAAMAGGSNSTSPNGASPGSAGTSPKPFGNLLSALAIPDFTGEESASTPVALGEIHTGDELLGMELVVPAGLGKKNLVFAIDRDKSNVNRWEIQFAERVSDVPIAVAEITKVNKELRFQWIAPAGTVNTINYLHNCQLRIKSPTDSTLCAMRAPVEIEPIVFTNKKASYRENLPVTFIPDDEFIVAELQQFSMDDFPGQNSENGYEVSARQPATEVYFHADAFQRFLAIGFKLETGSQIKIESSLLHNSLSGFVPYRESTFKDLGVTVLGAQLALQNEKMAADNYEPVYGEKTKHKDYVKELSKKLDQINLQVEGYNASAECLQRILDRPVHFRVMFKSDEVEIELARTKGWEIIGNAPAAGESR